MYAAINSFKNSFMNASGIHQPKKIDCVCSDGVTRSLLLKVIYILYIFLYYIRNNYFHIISE